MKDTIIDANRCCTKILNLLNLFKIKAAHDDANRHDWISYTRDILPFIHRMKLAQKPKSETNNP